MLKLWIILLSIILQNSFCIGQDTTKIVKDFYSWDFYHYLNKADLQEEALTWLLEYPESLKNDSTQEIISLEIAKKYTVQKNFKQADHFLHQIRTFADSASLNLAVYMALACSDTSLVSSYVQQYNHLLNIESLRRIQLTFQIIRHQEIKEEDVPSAMTDMDFRTIVLQYKLHKRKSPFLAGALSAIVPGLGKLYLGYKYQAISAFTMNIGVGLICAEYFIKSTSVLKWCLPLPLTLIFYTGNIYGTVMAARKQEYDFTSYTNENIHSYFYNRALRCM